MLEWLGSSSPSTDARQLAVGSYAGLDSDVAGQAGPLQTLANARTGRSFPPEARGPGPYRAGEIHDDDLSCSTFNFDGVARPAKAQSKQVPAGSHACPDKRLRQGLRGTPIDFDGHHVRGVSPSVANDIDREQLRRRFEASGIGLLARGRALLGHA